MRLMVLIEGIATPYEPGVFRQPLGEIEKIRQSKPVPGRPDPQTPPPGPGRAAAKAYGEVAKSKAPPRKALVARDLMTTPVVTVAPTSTIAEARDLFAKHRFRHLPVSRDGRRLEGIISDRDVLAVEARTLKRPVSELMTLKVLVASADTSLRTIAGTLFEERIGGMPIVNDEAQLIGILTRSDILRAVVREVPLEIWI